LILWRALGRGQLQRLWAVVQGHMGPEQPGLRFIRFTRQMVGHQPQGCTGLPQQSRWLRHVWQRSRRNWVIGLGDCARRAKPRYCLGASVTTGPTLHVDIPKNRQQGGEVCRGEHLVDLLAARKIAIHG